MNPKQSDQPNNKDAIEQPATDTIPNTPPKEVVDKVVDKLSAMGMLDDPNRTWTGAKNPNSKPELDLTLTAEDEDFSTQPLPEDMISQGNWTKGDAPEVVESIIIKPDLKVSAQSVDNDDKLLASATHNPPWTLQQFFNGEIDLNVELGRRFTMMPMMSIIKTRALGTNTGRKVAELTSQDGAASMIIDADTLSKVIQLSFTFGSMLTLKFIMNDLGNMDRDRWVELMRREAGGLAFLWGTKRWASDYLICITRKHFTNLYAFSPNNFEAGIRLTPTVTTDLLDWLEQVWDEPEPDNEPPQLLTW